MANRRARADCPVRIGGDMDTAVTPGR